MAARCVTTVAGVALTGSATYRIYARGGLQHSTDTLKARIRAPLPPNAARSTTRFAWRDLRGGLSGDVLPPNDGLGWTLPDQTPPDIMGMVVTVAGGRLQNARIRRCDIKLSDRGGYESCTLAYALKRVGELTPAWHARLLIEYKGSELFRGRLEETTCEVADDLVRTMVFTGPICKFDDHQAFRRVYVDSDLDNWETGQGPQTASNVWEVQAL